MSTNVPVPLGEEGRSRRQSSQPLPKASPMSTPPLTKSPGATPLTTSPTAQTGASPAPTGTSPTTNTATSPTRVASARPFTVPTAAKTSEAAKGAILHSPQPRKSLLSSSSHLRKEDTDSPSPANTSSPAPRKSTDTSSSVPHQSGTPSARQSSESARSPSPDLLQQHNLAQSPPPPPSSPTDGTSALAVKSTARRSHRPSMTASPPARDFQPGSVGRPSSVASSINSPRGLPIPTSSSKGVPAAPVATSIEGSPSPSSFEPSVGPQGRRLSKKSSVASLQARDEALFKSKSPLGQEGGFLSGLSLSRKRNSGGTAVDMLKRLEGGSGS